MANPGRFRRIFPVFIILFAAPIIVILIFKFGKNTYKQLPYYGGMSGIAPNGDTIRHAVTPFHFYDQLNRPYGADSLKGKIYIASFFYTHFPDSCLRLTRNLKKIQERFRKDVPFRMVLFSTDATRDNPAQNPGVLTAFAKKNGLKSYQWQLLSAPFDSVINVMGDNGYLLTKKDVVYDGGEGSAGGALIHSDTFVLVDKEGHVRGRYNGNDENEVERAVEDAHTLFVLYARQSGK